jgi:hypothetical protein
MSSASLKLELPPTIADHAEYACCNNGIVLCAAIAKMPSNGTTDPAFVDFAIKMQARIEIRIIPTGSIIYLGVALVICIFATDI